MWGKSDIYSYKKNKREGSGRYGLDSGFIGMMFVTPISEKMKRIQDMRNTQKILDIFSDTLSRRKDMQGNLISKKVIGCVEQLRKQNLSKEELRVLQICYQTAYNDSSTSTTTLVALLSVFLGLDPLLDMIPLPETIMMFVKGIVLILMVVYIFRKIDKTIKENEMFRNNIMASAILLEEMDKEKTCV